MLVGASVVYRIEEVVAPSNGSVARDAAVSDSTGRRGAVALLVGVASAGALTIAALSVAIVIVNKQERRAKVKLAESPGKRDKPFHQIQDVVS